MDTCHLYGGFTRYSAAELRHVSPELAAYLTSRPRSYMGIIRPLSGTPRYAIKDFDGGSRCYTRQTDQGPARVFAGWAAAARIRVNTRAGLSLLITPWEGPESNRPAETTYYLEPDDDLIVVTASAPSEDEMDLIMGHFAPSYL